MSSKKKVRRKKFLIREEKRNDKKIKDEIISNPNSTMEEIAKALGIKLKWNKKWNLRELQFIGQYKVI